MSVMIGAVLVALAFALIICWLRLKVFQPRLGMPSLAGLPVLGNLLQIDPAKPHLSMADWSKSLGSIYCLRLFGKNLVVCNDFGSIHEALVEKGWELAGRPRTFRTGCITNQFRNIGFWNPCSDWRVLRKVVLRGLKTYGDGLHKLETITAKIIREMNMDLVPQSSTESVVDLRPHLYSATMNVICAYMVEEHYAKTDPEFLMFQEMERLGVTLFASAGKGAELDAFPWLRFFGNETYKKIVRFTALRDKLYERIKKKMLEDGRCEENGRTGKDCLMRSMLELVSKRTKERSATDSQEPECDRITEEHVKGTFTDLILGGTASTTNLSYAYINLLLQNVQVYAKVKAEIRECMKQSEALDDVALEMDALIYHPNFADRASMPYTQASILELFRYVCIAPFVVPHKALVDTTLGGHQVPRGTEVLCNLWAIQHDESFWGDPWTFRPERFLTTSDDGSLELLPANHPFRRVTMMTFGAGPRHCIGEIFASNRLFLCVTGLLRDFDIYPDPESPPVSHDPRTYSLGIALYPMDYKVKLVKTEFFGKYNSNICGIKR